MRLFMALLGATSLLALTGCAQIALKDATTNFQKCAAENKATPEGRMLALRLWQNDGTDTAAKLSDPKPLTQPERDALVQLHTRGLQCRQILVTYDNRFAAWETPYFQELFQRSDEIFSKLASGEVSVGVANRLNIESVGKFQVDVSKGHAEAVRIEEAQRQRAAEALLQASAQIAASQPRPHMTMTNCHWLGNMLNCTTM
jgi:hypothetical protein